MKKFYIILLSICRPKAKKKSFAYYGTEIQVRIEVQKILSKYKESDVKINLYRVDSMTPLHYH